MFTSLVRANYSGGFGLIEDWKRGSNYEERHKRNDTLYYNFYFTAYYLKDFRLVK